ncbi:MAG: autotransporter domain-containing protein [Rhizobiaceae bacterium]
MRSIIFTCLFVISFLLAGLITPTNVLAADVTCIGTNQLNLYNREATTGAEQPFLRITPTACEHLDFTTVTALSSIATTDSPVLAQREPASAGTDYMHIHWKSGGNITSLTVNNVPVAADTDVELHSLAAGTQTEYKVQYDHSTAGTRVFTFDVAGNQQQFLENDFTITTITKVTNVLPATGPTAGGTKVTITGQSLTGTTDVTFNGVPATGITFINDTEIEAITPAGVSGTASVQVTSATGFNSANTLFSYGDGNSGTRLSDTEKQIIEFMHGRAVNLLNTKPDLTGFINGTNSADALLGLLDIDANSNGFNLSFSSSLGRIWSKQEANEILAYSANADHMSAGSKIGKPRAGSTDNKAQMHSETSAYQSPDEANSIAQERGYDMWIQLHAAKSNAGTVKSDLWVGHAGTHAFLSSDLLVGVMGQLDWAEQSNSSTGSSVQGLGWMLGPYLATRLPEQNLYFDTRILWGQSNNTISPDGSYEDRFKTERWMANAKLSGVIAANGWTIQPAIEVNYFQETLSSYTDRNNTVVSKRSISLGEIRFGPSVSRQWTTNDGIVVRPSAGVTGVLNFAVENEGHSPASGLGSNDLRARFEAGLTIGRPDEWALNVSGFYDGVGTDNFESYGGSIRLVIPLP